MSKSSKRFVIFDFDGTLADTLSLALDLGNTILEDMGREPATQDMVEEARGMSLGQLLRHFRISYFQVPSLVVKGRSLMSERIKELEPNKGMVELVGELNKQKIPCGIVSTNSRGNVLQFMKRHELSGKFAFIDGGSGVWSKARRLKSTLKKHGLTPETAVYVGDEIRDIEAARKVGLPVVSVTWGLNNKQRLEKSNPDYMVSTSKQLERLLTKELQP